MEKRKSSFFLGRLFDSIVVNQKILYDSEPNRWLRPSRECEEKLIAK
jgi:hypothetical protein